MEPVLHESLAPKQFDRPSVVPMIYEDYLALSDEVHTVGLVEWANNEVIFHARPNINHQDIVLFLAVVVGSFVDFFKLGHLLICPVEVKLPNGNSREPDVLFVSNEHLSRITPQRIDGAPDLIIEIVSPESVGRDFDAKFDEYQDAGVQEYWVIDPRRKQVLFYQLGSDGLFKLANVDNGIYRSKIISGFWLRVDWLWQIPDALASFGEIVGTDTLINALKQSKKGNSSN